MEEFFGVRGDWKPKGVRGKKSFVILFLDADKQCHCNNQHLSHLFGVGFSLWSTSSLYSMALFNIWNLFKLHGLLFNLKIKYILFFMKMTLLNYFTYKTHWRFFCIRNSFSFSRNNNLHFFLYSFFYFYFLLDNL